MRKISILLVAIVLFACEKDDTKTFNITNQISNYCYTPTLYFDDGSTYAINYNISSLGMSSEKITTKSDKFKFKFTNRDNQTFINSEWVDITGDNIIIGSHMKFKRYE